MILAALVVFHTVAGDLAFSVRDNQTGKQFVKLAQAGVYDTTAFIRVHPGFIVQLSNARDRSQPLTPQQTSLLRALPYEPGEAKHVRGVLSMVHDDSSFCILLGNAPQMDGSYTIFGELIAGQSVLDEMLQVSRDSSFHPSMRLTVNRAEVVEKLPALSPPRVLVSSAPSNPMLAIGLMLIISLSLAGALLKKPKLARSLNLIAVFTGMFLLLAVAMPEAQHRPLLASLLFFALIGLFRALGRFETAAG